MSVKILLCTLNSTYQHCSLGLRYLYANLGELRPQAEVVEFTIAQNPNDIVEQILAKKPQIVGFGVYIWNSYETLRVVEIIKAVEPTIIVVLGGPEVSHEAQGQRIVQLADHVIQGEADFLFADLCRDRLEARTREKIIDSKLPEIGAIRLPYDYFTSEDIAHRIIYVEASRGCPYRCEYCLSSLDKAVRNFELDGLLSEFDILIQRGARQFKFVDRTFNLSPTISKRILQFFKDRIHLDLFLHFELVPDRLPEELKALIKDFPAGSIQFEIGIQTFNSAVAKNISRRQNYELINQNLTYLRQHTKVHTHVDLIVGLPGENLKSFGQGFDQLISLKPDEIQVGILKRLKGFPLARHDETFNMKYSSTQPYQILQTKDLPFSDLQKLVRFAKTWDLVGNSGNFPRLVDGLIAFIESQQLSCFAEISKLAEFLKGRFPNGYGIALVNLCEALYIYFKDHPIHQSVDVCEILALDYAYKRRRSLPKFLRTGLKEAVFLMIQESNQFASNDKPTNSLSVRQQKHLTV